MNRPRSKMPLYAVYDAITVSGEQLHKILRGRNPFKDDSPNYASVQTRGAYRIARLRDGSWWVENYRYGAPLFAPDYWWPISAAAGERAEKLREFLNDL